MGFFKQRKVEQRGEDEVKDVDMALDNAVDPGMREQATPLGESVNVEAQIDESLDEGIL